MVSPGLVQRCVIIQRDQHGFGFTVSGDRIVLVQSVRPGERRRWGPSGGGGGHTQAHTGALPPRYSLRLCFSPPGGAAMRAGVQEGDRIVKVSRYGGGE